MKSFSKPTNEQVAAAIPLLSSPEHEQYFFVQLKNPHWIEPLKERDLFIHPPSAVLVEGDGLRYAHWPASNYLARMAQLAPQQVAEIFANIETDNALVIGDLLDAALAMPAKFAATLVPATCKAIKAGAISWRFDDASKLCVKLAKGRDVNSAMLLTKTLFAPRAQPNWASYDHWYKEGLKKIIPVLVAKRAKEFLSALSDWLRILVEEKEHIDRVSGWDGSYIWRPAIEEHEQNKTYEFAGEMVGLVRWAFDHAIQNGCVKLKVALSILDSHIYLVFKRLRVHLINSFAEQDVKLARQTMMNRELFDDFRMKHEYAMLVGKRLPMLSQNERRTWFAWIEAGPDMTNFDESFERNLDKAPTDDHRQARIQYWQFERLHWVRDHLESEWQEFYQQMFAKHGEPTLADLNIRMGTVRWGDDSPFTVPELQKMPFAEAVNRVCSWREDKSQFDGPRIEGLASAFEQYVNSSPEKFSKEADALRQLFAIYVRKFIAAMSEAVKGNKEIDVPSVLRLCKWVVDQNVEQGISPIPIPDGIVDPDWQSTRESICDFIEKICAAEANKKPTYPLEGIREDIARILEQLKSDPARSHVVHDTKKEDPQQYDYLGLAINSPRGKAMQATLEYARWVAKHKKQTKNGREIVPDGFKIMPEIRAILEWHIEPENSSFAARALIGSRFGLLYWIDKEWLARWANRIFDLGQIEKDSSIAYGWAAWNAFLVWVQPHTEFYKILRSQYKYAVERSSNVQPTENRREEQPMYHLGVHLIILYGRKQLDFDEKGLIKQFLLTTGTPFRCHAIEFVGNSIQGEENVPPDVLERFIALWDWYWPAMGQKDAEQNPQCNLFGTWFAYGKFPLEWSLKQLDDFVRIVPIPEPDHEIVKRLAEIARADLTRATAILDRMIRADSEGWRIYDWREDTKKILGLAMKADQGVRKTAIELIDYLGRRGYTDFGELLDS